MKKRLLSTLLALCMVLALLPGTAQAEEASGTCGANVTWTYSDGTLTIEGTGPMDDYYMGGTMVPNRPWDDYIGGVWDDVETIFENGLYYKLQTVIIGDGVTHIGSAAFDMYSNLTSVTIPNSVTSIGQSAFYECRSLINLTIPNSVTEIGDEAFFRCYGLTNVTIPDSVTSIGYAAFMNCINMTNVTIPDSITSIEEATFISCHSLTSVTIPDSVTSIGEYAFYECTGLTSVTIPNSVASIGDDAFGHCTSLTSVTIPDSVTDIGEEVFYECNSLTSVIIPNSVISIGDRTFAYCNSLISLDIPSSVTNIGNAAFGACDSLTSVTIPNSVTSIGIAAFYQCGSLTDVYYSGSESQWEDIALGEGNDPLINATIHYNTGEYFYNIPDPGEDTTMDADRLNSVTDPATAAEAVRDQVNGMTQAQKESATGIDLATLYAETAVAKAASKPMTGTDILINAAAVADLEVEAAQAVIAVETALVDGGIATARYLSNTVTLTTSSTSEITIRLDPDILTTSVDKIRVEGPSYALTFKIADWADALTEVLTFKAAPVNPGARAAVSSVNIDLPGGSSSNPVTVSLPTDTGTDTTYQAVVSSTGGATASKYNPATTNIDGKVNTSGTYTVETKEVDFTDIANKSAEMQKAIKYLAARDILGGTGDNKFSPDASISRAELAKLVVMALGKLDNGAASKFSDVTKSDWFYAVVASSQKLGYIGGYEDNTFRGKSVISKNEIVVIAARVLGTEMKYKMPDNAETYLGKYSDTVAAWAQPQVALATKENLIVYRTDGTFSGAKDMTRGDAAIVLYRLFQKLW